MSPWTGSQEATEPLQHKREPFGPSHLRRSTMSNILSCLILSSVVAVESSFHLPIIVGVTLAIIGVMCLITTVILIYRRCTVIRQGQPGTYVNVPLPGGHSNQDSPITDSTYMSLNLNDQSLYSQLHR
ncbi:uncharacterized protein LOC119974550 isoform X2 [Scyliorhinus canicula]|uniref:uncharacterized protein LOC119974550 isoform X2 n=1 Tax=Scyliorhinus canicula TaxID=7830 RepID=UPI0018F35167|nr:uncharacterized protein LOC119974550 isoform X2 [Scyliorhinus canicula]